MIAEVIVDVLSSNVDRVFDYVVPNELNVQIGDRVSVPFGSRKVDGFVINFKDNSDYDREKLKSIICKLDTQPLLSQNAVRLCFFMKSHFYLRLADTLRLFLPPSVRNMQAYSFVFSCIFLTEGGKKSLNVSAKRK